MLTGSVALAQSARSGGERENKRVPVEVVSGDDVVVMLADLMMLVQKGSAPVQVNSEMMLSNGTRLFPNGTIQLRDGRKLKLSNTQMMMMSGEIVPAPSDVLAPQAKPAAR